MFSILDRRTRLCDGISRRELLRVGGLSTLGLSLPALLKAAQGPPPGIIEDPTFGRAKNVIYVWLQGGPPQHETFDPKPDAPLEIRGAFKPIQTNVPGIHFCELLPRIARMADKLAVVRSMATDSNQHEDSGYEVLTGYKYQGPNARMIHPTDWPYFGSILKMLRPSEKLPPLTAVWIPQIMRLNENVTPPGQTAGFLGPQWAPDRFEGDPSAPDYQVEGLRTINVAPMRLERRMSLLTQVEQHFGRLERGPSVGVYDQYQQQAFDLLVSGRVKKAFDISQEPDDVRDRFGRHKWGQCLLLARRLVEVGVRLVHVNWAREPGDSAVDNPMWDTHAQNADRVEDVLCPMFDVGFTALLEDLDQRGLLSETLVVCIGEFGRTPKINKIAGRDHWGSVFSFALAGAGIQTGQVYGASDRDGGFPARDRVTPADLTATIFHSLGLHHESTFHDAQKREHRATTGAPIRALLGGGQATDARVPAGGNIARVPPYDNALLLNTNFQADVPLYPVDLGSRPKGWRATPRVERYDDDSFGVRIVGPTSSTSNQSPPLPSGERAGVRGEAENTTVASTISSIPALMTTTKSFAAIGFGMAQGQTVPNLTKGTQALLAQEMRNPRLGTFVFTIRAGVHASSKELYEELFTRHLTCRLVIYRYKDSDKNPLRREDFISVEFRPQFADSPAAELQEFQVSKHLDSPGPGQNFPIGNGYGVAVIVEKTSDAPFDLSAEPGPAWAFLRIDEARLDFAGRTINEKVKV